MDKSPPKTGRSIAITVQFEDGSLFTCYWITMEDGITHVAATKWRIDEI